MKRALAILTSVMVLCFLCSAVWAVPITFWDTINPDPNFLVSVGNPFNGTFNINGPGTGHGYNAGTDTILSASLDLNLKDNDRRSFNESVTVTLGDTWTTASNANLWLHNFDVGQNSFAAHLSFLENGLLNISISSNNGDFYFNDATLTVKADRFGVGSDPGASPAAPEPQTLMLLGSGLLFMAGFRIRKKNKNN